MFCIHQSKHSLNFIDNFLQSISLSIVLCRLTRMELIARLLFRCNLFPLFYNEIQYLIESYGRKGRVLAESLVCLSFLVFAIRFALYGYSMWAGWAEWQSWELSLSLVNRSKMLNYLVYFGVALFMLFMAYINYLIHFTRVDTPVWQLIYDLTVRNYRQFISRHNQRPRFSNRLLGTTRLAPTQPTNNNPILFDRIKFIASNMWIGNIAFYTRLPHFPRISIQTRSRALLQHCLLEVITSLGSILYRKSMLESAQTNPCFSVCQPSSSLLLLCRVASRTILDSIHTHRAGHFSSNHSDAFWTSNPILYGQHFEHHLYGLHSSLERCATFDFEYIGSSETLTTIILFAHSASGSIPRGTQSNHALHHLQ